MHRATAREIRSVHHGFSNSLPNRTPNSFLNSSASASGAVKAQALSIAASKGAVVHELLILEARFRKVKIKTRETAVAVEKMKMVIWCAPKDGSTRLTASSSAAEAVLPRSPVPTEIHFDLPISFSSLDSVFPGTCPLRCKGNQFSSWAGVRVRAKITLLVENQEILTEQGELQLTDYGVSGIPVFQISRFAVLPACRKNALNFS